jgi:hypothetical protein
MTKQVASFTLSPEAIKILEDTSWAVGTTKSDFLDTMIKASYTKEVKAKVELLLKQREMNKQ